MVLMLEVLFLPTPHLEAGIHSTSLAVINMLGLAQEEARPFSAEVMPLP